MKQKWVNAYMQAAEIFAGLSSARRLHVGCIVVKDDRIISIGYNGMPSGWDNNCEDEVIVESDEKFIKALKTKPEVLHAETNAIAKLARSSESGLGADLFVTHAPCIDCAKLIYQSGISKVYYRNQYRNTEGIDFLIKCNVQIENVNE